MAARTPRSSVPDWLAPILATVNRPDYERDTVIFNATCVLTLVLGGLLIIATVIAFDAV